GVQYVRTRVDVSDRTLKSVEALLEIKDEVKPYMDIQLVVLPQQGMYTRPDGIELLVSALEMGADVVGGIPHYEPTREDGVRSVHKSLELADKYGKRVDIHCDEIDDNNSRFLEVL